MDEAEEFEDDVFVSIEETLAKQRQERMDMETIWKLQEEMNNKEVITKINIENDKIEKSKIKILNKEQIKTPDKEYEQIRTFFNDYYSTSEEVQKVIEGGHSKTKNEDWSSDKHTKKMIDDVINTVGSLGGDYQQSPIDCQPKNNKTNPKE